MRKRKILRCVFEKAKGSFVATNQPLRLTMTVFGLKNCVLREFDGQSLGTCGLRMDMTGFM